MLILLLVFNIGIERFFKVYNIFFILFHTPTFVLSLFVMIVSEIILASLYPDDSVLVGMGSIIMDDCIIGSNSIIAAGCVLPKGTIVPPNT